MAYRIITTKDVILSWFPCWGYSAYTSEFSERVLERRVKERIPGVSLSGDIDLLDVKRRIRKIKHRDRLCNIEDCRWLDGRINGAIEEVSECRDMALLLGRLRSSTDVLYGQDVTFRISTQVLKSRLDIISPRRYYITIE